MRWVWIASAGVPAVDGARRPCLLAARVLPPSWGEWVAGGPVGEGLAPVNLAGSASLSPSRSRCVRRGLRQESSHGSCAHAGNAASCAPGRAPAGLLFGLLGGLPSVLPVGLPVRLPVGLPVRSLVGLPVGLPVGAGRRRAPALASLLFRAVPSFRAVPPPLAEARLPTTEDAHRDLPQRANSPSWPPRSLRDCAPAPRPRPRGSEPWNASGWAARSGPTTFIRAPSTSGHASRRGGAPS